MSRLTVINSILKNQPFPTDKNSDSAVYTYAQSMATIENCVAVVSDLRLGTSRIYAGEFGSVLGLDDYTHEDSIWEKQILTLMDESEREEKFLAELRFYNYLRRLPRSKRHIYYLVTHLRFKPCDARTINVTHRMYYRYEASGDAIRYAICIYSPTTSEFKVRSMVINTLTGTSEALTHLSDNKILSRRELQVLSLIERGFTSSKIADELCISPHTVSRHRQEIISKLQVRNTTEACLTARHLGIL